MAHTAKSIQESRLVTFRLRTYRLGMALLHRIRSIRLSLTVLAMGFGLIARRARLPRVLLCFGVAAGDDLLCTAVLRELRKRGCECSVMISNYSELFIGNEDATYVWPAGDGHDDQRRVTTYQHFAKIWGGDFRRTVYPGGLQGEQPSRHIIAHMCANTGITGTISVRPYLQLSEEEKSGAAWANGLIVIQSSGMAARLPIRNKQWFPERFQGVVDALSQEFEFIQVGSISDPPLKRVHDLRGATTIRETASILYNARLYVGGVGFLMHIARAVECPSVIIFGGREAPWQSGYICNANLYSAVPCAPCWLWNSCDFDRKCMTDISVADVVSAIRQMIVRPRDFLAVETVDVG